MKRFFAFATSSTLACAMLIAPALAETGGGTTNSTASTMQHDLDCLALLFTNPAKHATECGGPTFNPAPPPSSGGFGTACHFAAIDLVDIVGSRVLSDAPTLVANTGCCISELTGPGGQPEGVLDPIWAPTDRAWFVTTIAAC